MDALEKSQRAQAYMQMTVDSDGWKHLRAWLEQQVQEAADGFVDEKRWHISDGEKTSKIFRAQCRAWAWKKVIRHVESEIAGEREAREKADKANHGDSPK